MKLLAYVHGYPPVHNAGAEWAMHGILAWLAARGHEVTVYAPTRAKDLLLDGVRVITAVKDVPALFREYDLVFTHLDNTGRCIAAARLAGIPVVHYIHNHQQLTYHQVTPADAALVILNAEWLRGHYARFETLTVHPPIQADRYRVKAPGEGITLVNVSPAKGSRLFWDLAKKMPDLRFLGVRGSYGAQIVKAGHNVTMLDNTPDMRAVYARTRILLMPSEYESWGRVAMEAAVSGIPTIAHPTEGLQECLGDAGIFVDRNQPDQWAAALRRLSDPKAYAAASKRAKARCKTFARLNERQLQALEKRLPLVIASYRAGRPLATESGAEGPLPDILIACQKTRLFRHPETRELHRIDAGYRGPVPGWVGTLPYFRLNVDDGTISLLAVEKPVRTRKAATAKEEPSWQPNRQPADPVAPGWG